MLPQLQLVRVIWAFVKRYAWILFAVTTFVLAYVLLRRPAPDDLSQQLEDIRRRHEDELRAIKRADDERLRQRDLNEKRLQEALALLDERHRKQIADMDAQKRAVVDRILKEKGDDPRALAEALAAQLDLRVE